MVHFPTLLRCANETFWWFLSKLTLGAIVAYVIPRWIYVVDGRVVIHWEAYVVGAIAVGVLWLISDVREEYRRRRPKPRRRRRN